MHKKIKSAARLALPSGRVFTLRAQIRVKSLEAFSSGALLALSKVRFLAFWLPQVKLVGS